MSVKTLERRVAFLERCVSELMRQSVPMVSKRIEPIEAQRQRVLAERLLDADSVTARIVHTQAGVMATLSDGAS